MHLQELGEPYPVQGARDGESIRRLPKAYDTAKLMQLQERFFRLLRTDQFLREKIGATIPAFVAKLSALVGQRGPSSSRMSTVTARPTELSLYPDRPPPPSHQEGRP